jgi:hypothetical protein
VEEAAAERISEHVQGHGMEANGERWLKYGVDHMISENCPFWAQNTKGIGLVKAFKDFFSEAYSDHSRKVEAEAQRAKALREDGPTPLRAMLTQNSADLTFWDGVAELPAIPEISAAEVLEIEKGIVALCAAFDAKMVHPFSSIALDAVDRNLVADCSRAVAGLRY